MEAICYHFPGFPLTTHEKKKELFASPLWDSLSFFFFFFFFFFIQYILISSLIDKFATWQIAFSLTSLSGNKWLNYNKWIYCDFSFPTTCGINEHF